MAYEIELDSREITLSSGDTYQLVLTFTVDDSGSNESHLFVDKEIDFISHGKLGWEFTLEDTFLVPGQVTIKLHDGDSYLDGLLFGASASQLLTDKEFEVQIKVNGVEKFLGFVVSNTIDSIEYANHHEVSFMAMPRVDILNKTSIYDNEGLPIDPLGKSTGTAVAITNAVVGSGIITITHASDSGFDVGKKIVISGVVGMTDINRAFLVSAENSNTEFEVEFISDQKYISGGTATIMDFSTATDSITTLIDDCYDLTGATTTTVTDFGWEFDAFNGSNSQVRSITAAISTDGGTKVQITHSPAGYLVGESIWIKEVEGMTDLNGEYTITDVPSATTTKVANTTGQTYTTGGRVKKILSVDITDPIKVAEEAFFDPEEAQAPTGSVKTIGDVLRQISSDFFCYTGMVRQGQSFFKRMFTYDSGDLQTVDVINRQKSYRTLKREYVKVSYRDNEFYEAGTLTTLESKKFEKQLILQADALLTSFINIFDTSLNSITHVKDPEWDDTELGWLPIGKLLANLYHKYFSDQSFNRVDMIECDGVDYDPLQNFNYDGSKYWPIKLVIDFENNTSTFDAVYLGEV